MPKGHRAEPQLAIEHCRLRFHCTKRWSELADVAGEPKIRFCTECQRAVHRVSSDEEFDRHAKAGHCIAIECNYVQAMTGEPLHPASRDNGGV